MEISIMNDLIHHLHFYLSNILTETAIFYIISEVIIGIYFQHRRKTNFIKIIYFIPH